MMLNVEVCVGSMVVLSTVMLRVNDTDWNCCFVTMRVPGVDEEVLVSFMKNNLSVYLEGKNKYIKNKTFSRNTTYATFVRLSLHKSYFNIFFSKLTPTLLSGLSTLLTVNVPSAFTVKRLSSVLKRITVRSVQSVKPTGKG